MAGDPLQRGVAIGQLEDALIRLVHHQKKDETAGMPTIIAETEIRAPLALCFDLARDVATHCLTTADTEERIVEGRSAGLLELGDVITFEAVHLGVRQRLSTKIIECDPPHRFVDQMVKGVFKSLNHLHEFEKHEHGTLMRDTLKWESPLGILGKLADSVVVRRHMRRFLLRRNRELKRIVEARACDQKSDTK